MRLWLAIGALLASSPVFTFGQVVCTSGPCNVDRTCKDEKAPANLSIDLDRRVQGVVHDQSGAVLADSKRTFEAQLRDVRKGTVFASAMLDNSGRFELGKIAAGEYRLIIVLKEGGIAKRFGFDQAKHLACSGGAVCEINVVLPAGSTDRLENFCSPK